MPARFTYGAGTYGKPRGTYADLLGAGPLSSPPSGPAPQLGEGEGGGTRSALRRIVHRGPGARRRQNPPPPFSMLGMAATESAINAEQLVADLPEGRPGDVLAGFLVVLGGVGIPTMDDLDGFSIIGRHRYGTTAETIDDPDLPGSLNSVGIWALRKVRTAGTGATATFVRDADEATATGSGMAVVLANMPAQLAYSFALDPVDLPHDGTAATVPVTTSGEIVLGCLFSWGTFGEVPSAIGAPPHAEWATVTTDVGAFDEPDDGTPAAVLTGFAYRSLRRPSPSLGITSELANAYRTVAVLGPT